MKTNKNKIKLLSGALMISLMGGLNPSYANSTTGFAKIQTDDCEDGPHAGTLTATNSILCTSEDSGVISAAPNGDEFIPEGYSKIYVLTKSNDLVISQVSAVPEFTIDREGVYRIHTLIYDPNTLDLGIVELGVTTGFDVNGLLVQGGGSICASLDVEGARISALRPLAGTLTADPIEECSINGSTTLTATPNGDAKVPFFGNFQTIFVLTKGSDLVIQGVNSSPNFTVSESGSYKIHTLIYNANTLDLGIVVLGVTTGFDVNGLLIQGGGSICASLDVAGASFDATVVNSGTLTADASSSCLDNGSAILSATPNGDISIPSGYSVVYVLTEGSDLVIQQVSLDPNFEVNAEGNYTIHTLVYDANTLDLGIVVIGGTTGFDVNGLLVQGGGSICASLDVAGAPIVVANPSAGTLTAESSSVCLGESATLTATPNGDINVPTGYSVVYVLTEGSGLVIQQAGAEPTFTVTTGGNYTIHTLVYDANTLDLGIVVPGVTTGFDVNGLLVQGGGSICASLDVAGAPIVVANPSAGTLTAESSSVCLGESATLTATPNGDINVPTGYSVVYVLTEGSGLVIQQAGAEPTFTVTTGGNYTIHTLVYDANTLDLGIVVPGVTTGFDVNGLLVQGGGSICASLDVAGAPIVVANPSAGTLTAESSSVCLGESATLTATPNGDINVPTGYSVVYVLTEGSGLVIQQAGAEPTFTVTTGGNYTIHTLVYDANTLDLGIVVPGVTTGFDVNGLLVQGGGSICASLDVAGAPIVVANPSAGTLTAESSSVCLGESATLTATPNGDINVPTGYSVVYVLTEGSGLVIQQAGAEPTFTVTTGGNYTIHTLVYDANTLDLGIVVPGVTTGFDVNGLLVQGGGSICASLDVAGAPIVVANPSAGTLTAETSSVCLGESATLTATPNGDINVPTGYSVVYVLTEGSGLVIQQAGAEPTFTVTTGGNYTIHTLVYDANTLDLGIVVPGVTTGFDVNGLLVQGGGSICASLDVAGAPIVVANPSAGTLTAESSSVCLGESATLTATPNGDINVPTGYSVVYVLTEGSGLVIQQAGAEPTFTVTTGGNYTIHTLVYDANTLDLGIVVPGVTTGFDVNGLLVQGGGSICASLDVAGAPIVVANPSAGTLTAESSSVCLGESATLTATPNGDINVPTGYSVVYVLTEGSGLVIQQAGAEPTFTVTTGGNYTIHTLVYDANTLDLGIVVPGVTTGFDVNGLLVQGGGSICASLDVAGASIVVANPSAGTLTTEDFIVCGENEAVTVTATPNGDAIVPTGYSTLFVLTRSSGLVIEQVNSIPEFTINSQGTYKIHTLVYDANTLDLSIVVLGVTTGFDVNGLLVQGGGSICASLDVAGASINAFRPLAGTVSTENSTVCLVEGEAVLTANSNGDAKVPFFGNYQTIFVLTEGSGLIIKAVNSEPSFTVTEAGNYTIHTLIYNSSLDLGIVEFGVTTGFDVNGLLVQGSGSICASLDVVGAAFTVESCDGGGISPIDEGSSANPISLYPNPANTQVIVNYEAEGDDQVIVTIKNMMGTTLFNQNILGSKGLINTHIDLSAIPTGNYLLIIQSNNKINSTKLFIQK